MYSLIRVISLCLLVSFFSKIHSQEVYEVEILPPTQEGIMQTINGETVKILVGNVKLSHKGNYIDCDSAIIYANNNIDAYSRVIIRKNNSTKIEGNKLTYLSLQKIAIMRGNVILTDKKAKLYVEDITYDMNNEVGEYLTGGKLINGETQITSQTGTIYSKENLVLFRQNVHVNHPKYTLDADSLMYNTKLKRTIFRTATKIVNDSGYIWCNSGWHDEDKNQSSFGRGTYIYNPPQWILTDSIYYDRANGFSHIYKTFEYHDTASKVHLFGDSAYMYNDNKDMIAYKRPMLIMESEENKPTFVRGDILEVKSKSKEDKVMKAACNVKLYNRDFQAAGDTLIYRTSDSSLYLTQDAYLWQEAYQLSGLKIWVYLKNKRPKRINVFGDAFMAQQEDVKTHYNQVSSDTNYIFFKNKEMDYLYAFGNAKSIYYGKEEGKGYLGLNNSESQSLKMVFDSSKPKKVIFYENPKAVFYPVKDINDGNRFLANFVWKAALRPKSKEDL